MQRETIYIRVVQYRVWILRAIFGPYIEHCRATFGRKASIVLVWRANLLNVKEILRRHVEPGVTDALSVYTNAQQLSSLAVTGLAVTALPST